MDYVLTQHAADVLAKRRIPLEWVERTIRTPERVEADEVDDELEHRLAQIPEYGNRVLRVIVNRVTNPERVITVYFDRNMRNRL
ncbi:MAG: DUF4258 domain-containing protein [Dehalococcoidia bacterium]